MNSTRTKACSTNPQNRVTRCDVGLTGLGLEGTQRDDMADVVRRRRSRDSTGFAASCPLRAITRLRKVVAVQPKVMLRTVEPLVRGLRLTPQDARGTARGH